MARVNDSAGFYAVIANVVRDAMSEDGGGWFCVVMTSVSALRTPITALPPGVDGEARWA